MSVTDPTPVDSFDFPTLTPELVAGLVLDVATSGFVLFGFTMDDAKKAALTTIINTISVVAFLVHGVFVRRARNAHAAIVKVARINAAKPLTAHATYGAGITPVTTPSVATPRVRKPPAKP